MRSVETSARKKGELGNRVNNPGLVSDMFIPFLLVAPRENVEEDRGSCALWKPQAGYY